MITSSLPSFASTATSTSDIYPLSLHDALRISILEESPHRPDITMEFAAKPHSVTAALPRIGVPQFNCRVPGMHGCCREGIADSRVALNGKPWSAPRVLASESNSLNIQRAHDIVDSVIL